MRYETEIDLSKSNTSHALMVELIGHDKRVLDMGCAGGHLAKVLNDRGCVVAGVEIDREAADLARPFLDQLVVGNLEELQLTDLFPLASFDVIVFGDVLEYLRDPLAVLRGCHPLLAPGGSVVVSIPNVAHGSVRLSLLQGNFRYRPLGLLAETHLRFFTRDSLNALLRDAGFVPVDVRRTHAGMFETEVAVDAEKVPSGVVEQLREDPDAETYQFVLTAVPEDRNGLLVELYERDREQKRELLRLGRERDKLAQGYNVESRSLQIGLWGQSHRADLSTVLTLAVTRGELMRRLPDASVRVFVPNGTDPAGLGTVEPVERLLPTSSQPATALAEQLDAIVIAGPLGAGHPLETLASGLSGLHRHGCMCLFSAVEVGPRGGVIADDLLRMVADSPYGTVTGGYWPEVAGLTDLFVPDPLLLLKRQYSSSLLHRRQAYLRVMGWYPEGPAIVIEGEASLLPHHRSIVQALDRLAAAEGGHVVVIEQGVADGDQTFASSLMSELSAPAHVVPIDAGSENLVAAIACGGVILASSPHLLAVAFAFGRRCVGLQFHGQPRIDDLARLTGGRVGVAREASEIERVAQRSATTEMGPEAIVDLDSRIDAHFDRMAEELLRHWRAKQGVASSAPADLVGLRARLDTVTAAHEALHRRLVAERNAFAERAAHLDEMRRVAGVSLFTSPGREVEVRAIEAQLEEARQELDAVYRTRTLRMLRPIRRFYARLRGRKL